MGVNGKANGPGAYAYGGGGGGSAILYKTPTMSDFQILVVAGGGGGAYTGACTDFAHGRPGSLGEATEGYGRFSSGGAGGIAGGGGGGSGHANGGGGAFTNGGEGSCGPLDVSGQGIAGYPEGGEGGVGACTAFGPSADGGYGFGGGGSGNGAGGGGGGYTGGGAGGHVGAGGGGGSYYGVSETMSFTFEPGATDLPGLPEANYGLIGYSTISNTLPIANCRPTTVFVGNGPANLFPSDFDNGSSDPDGTIASMTVSPAILDCQHVGTVQVTLTVTDNQGATATCVSEVTVIDDVRPTVITQDHTVYLDAAGQATISVADIDNGSSDMCGIKEMTLNQTNFDCSHIGANTITLKVVDNNDNFLILPATVTVKDNLPPIAMAQNITVYLDASGNASITAAQINNGSSDNCSIQSMNLSKYTFSCSNLGENTITLTVTDIQGNVSSTTAIVTVIDNLRPIINSVSTSRSRLWPVNHKMIPIIVTINSTDNCVGSGSCKIVSVASNEPTDGLGDGHTATDWAITGDNTLNLRAERAGNRSSRVYTITVECTDGSGNKSTSITTVLVPHDASARVASTEIEKNQNTENSQITIMSYPNPMNQTATISITSAISGKAKLDFYSSAGKSILSKPVEIILGENKIPINKSELKVSGLVLYRLTFTDENIAKDYKPQVGKIIIE